MAKMIRFELTIEANSETTMLRSAGDIAYRLIDVAKELQKGRIKGEIEDLYGNRVGKYEYILPRES